MLVGGSSYLLVVLSQNKELLFLHHNLTSRHLMPHKVTLLTLVQLTGSNAIHYDTCQAEPTLATQECEVNSFVNNVSAKVVNRLEAITVLLVLVKLARDSYPQIIFHGSIVQELRESISVISYQSNRKATWLENEKDVQHTVTFKCNVTQFLNKIPL